MHWNEIHGWFQWRSGQEEAALQFPEGICFIEVGTTLGRSLCSLGEVTQKSGKMPGNKDRGPLGRGFQSAEPAFEK